MLRIPIAVRPILAVILITYVIGDIVHSSLLLRRLEHFVVMFRERYERLEHTRFHSACSPFHRLLHTYPKMRHTVSEKMALLHAKQEALEQFLRLQRQKFSNPTGGNDPHSHS